MRAILIDTETTGMMEPKVVEMAWICFDSAQRPLEIAGAFEARYNPGKPIECGAKATHHITDSMVSNKPEFAPNWPERAAYMIGHNVDYDWRVVGEPPMKRICTMALARHYFPECDSHRLGALAYYLEGDSVRDMVMQAHGAAMDVRIAKLVLERLMEKAGAADWESLWQASEIARVPTHMPFGKHKGLPIAQVPWDYKKWLLRQDDVDEYLRRALTSA